MAVSRYLRDEMDTSFIAEASKKNVTDERYCDAVDDFLLEEKARLGGHEHKNDAEIVASILELVKGNLPERRSHRRQALCGIMWRLRAQSVVFDAFMDLCDARLIDISALQHGVDLSGRNHAVWDVNNALSAGFEFAREVKAGALFCPEGYFVPQLWLASMIIRGALAPVETIFEFIARRGTLGYFDAAAFRNFWPEGKTLRVDPLAMAMIPPGPQGFIGLHLPMGIGLPMKLEDVYYEIDEPLRRCEELFSRYFSICETTFVPAGRIWMP